jgi:hypothetical protein
LKDKISAYWKEFTADTGNQLAVRGLNIAPNGEHLHSKRHKWVGRPQFTTANVIIVKERGNFQKDLHRKRNQGGWGRHWWYTEVLDGGKNVMRGRVVKVRKGGESLGLFVGLFDNSKQCQLTMDLTRE